VCGCCATKADFSAGAGEGGLYERRWRLGERSSTDIERVAGLKSRYEAAVCVAGGWYGGLASGVGGSW
jgi:hypothetical protein